MPSCYIPQGTAFPPPRARSMYLRGLWNQYAADFLVAYRGGADNVRFVAPGAVPNANGGGSLVSVVTDTVPTYWHVNVQAREVLTPRVSETAEFVSNLLPGARPHSVLKVRIIWHMGMGCMDGPLDFFVDMDIGHGISTIVGPANGVTVEVLVPDPASIPATPPGYESVNFNTEVAASVICVDCCDVSFANRYTQSYFVAGEEVLAALHPSARRVQISSDSDTNLNPQWVTQTQAGPRELGDIQMDGAQTGSVEIPQTATHIRLRGGGVSFTVVEELLR